MAKNKSSFSNMTAGLFSDYAPVASDPVVLNTNGSEPVQEPQQLEQKTNERPTKKAKPGRKAAEEKKIQISTYLTEDQVIRIDEQTGYAKKERDKSALFRFALDIVLSLSDDEYKDLKIVANQREVSPGIIVSEALQNRR